MERFAQSLLEALHFVLPAHLPEKGGKGSLDPLTLKDLEFPPDPQLGDFAFPCFQLAQKWRQVAPEAKKNPHTLASDLAAALQASQKLPPFIQIQVQGGYINFLVDPTVLFQTLLKDILKTPYGTKPSQNQTWVLDYSSPNIAKPLNIYHLRPTVLGAALARIAQTRGYRVISINHLGDWGKQYGLLAMAFERKQIPLDRNLSLEDLVQLYVKINQEAEKDPSIHEKAKEAFVQLEKKTNPALTAFWKKCVTVSLVEFEKSYRRLGVQFDHVWGESYYQDLLEPLLESLQSQGILEESQGAQVVFVTNREGKELPPCILKKQDGASIYATRDLAAVLHRYEQFHFDRMTYIVGAEQKLHFEQLFGVLRRMKLPWEAGCEHLSFGLYRFQDAKMSTRKGNFITLEEVLNQVKEQVQLLLQEREKTPSSLEEKEQICEAIAIGAVVFHDLHTDPTKDVDFQIQKIISFEGETGPYLQYAHTRCLSILKKAQEAGYQKPLALLEKYAEQRLTLSAPEEIALIKVLGQFPLALERSLELRKVSQLAHYLIDVTHAFHRFYRECHVLEQSPEITEPRLLLVEATRKILSSGLKLLGIPLPDKM